MAKPITLNVRDVALAAKKAYDEKRLSAQGPTPACQYRDASNRPCAIGAALSDEQASDLDDYSIRGDTMIATLARKRAVRSDNTRALTQLQKAHDDWTWRPHSADRETAFVATLNRILAKAEA